MSEHHDSPADAPAKDFLPGLVEQFVGSYNADTLSQHLDATFLPSRDTAIQILELLRKVMFPGFFDESRVTQANVRFHVGDLLNRTYDLLYEQVRQALRYQLNSSRAGSGDQCDDCDTTAAQIATQYMRLLPGIREMLVLDVKAAFDGDPASVSTDENIFCYPGIDAIFTYRLAHELWKLDVPLMPRILTEYAHNQTGIDIHPGATIGESFFIDHGTGVVIGETSIIGRRVKIYQGVTLGALSTKGGQAWRGRKRHPTIEDDVTIYPNATILGGETVIGARCVINGGVFLTHSVDPDHTVRVDHPEPQLRARRKPKTVDQASKA
jgi:serine O-acetyltransferase